MTSHEAYGTFFTSTEINLRIVMRVHAVVSIVLGALSVIVPHRLFTKVLTNYPYNHMAHEFVRVYGVMTLCIGWLVWSTQDIRDGRLMRAISETFSICYVLQAAVMFRAQFTSPDGHSLMHWMIAVLFLSLGSLYGHVRLARKIKGYELPGHESE